MTEFMNLREGSWLLFALSFISRSLGELNAWLSLRRAQWRVSTSPSPCAFGCMCMPVCVQWGKAPLPPDPKGTHSTKNLSDAHSTWQYSRLELDAHMCPHADHLSAFSAIKKKKKWFSLPAVSFHLRALSCYFVKVWWRSVSLQRSFLFPPPQGPRLNCRSAHQGWLVKRKRPVDGDWKSHGRMTYKDILALHFYSSCTANTQHLGWWLTPSH